MDSAHIEGQIETALDDITYAVTGARTAGLEQPDRMRAALRKIRSLVDDADSLVSHLVAERTQTGDE